MNFDRHIYARLVVSRFVFNGSIFTRLVFARLILALCYLFCLSCWFCLNWVPCADATEKAHAESHAQSHPQNHAQSHPANGQKYKWCHEAVTENWPDSEANKIGGTIAGRAFECDKVQWNSYSLTLKQNRKRYCKIVINMMKTQKPLCRLSFTSDSNRRPEIYVYTRDNNAAKIVEKHYTTGDGYGLRLELRDLVADDAVPGRLVLRLPDGSAISGQFLAEKAPRVIWDDEQIK